MGAIVDSLKRLVVALGGESSPAKVPGNNVAEVIDEVTKVAKPGGATAGVLVLPGEIDDYYPIIDGAPTSDIFVREPESSEKKQNAKLGNGADYFQLNMCVIIDIDPNNAPLAIEFTNGDEERFRIVPVTISPLNYEPPEESEDGEDQPCLLNSCTCIYLSGADGNFFNCFPTTAQFGLKKLGGR